MTRKQILEEQEEEEKEEEDEEENEAGQKILYWDRPKISTKKVDFSYDYET